MKKSRHSLFLTLGLILFCALLLTCSSPLDNNNSVSSKENVSKEGRTRSTRPTVIWEIFMEEDYYYPDEYSCFIELEVKDIFGWSDGKWE